MIIGERKHTFPSRTRSLSSQPPMVVRPRCRARVGCCQSYEAGYPKGCPASLVLREWGIGTTKFAVRGEAPSMMSRWLIWRQREVLLIVGLSPQPYPLRRSVASTSFSYLATVLEPVYTSFRLGSIHCCQSYEPRCPKGCRGSLCFTGMGDRYNEVCRKG